MAITTNITITPELAITIGRLAQQHRNQSVEIRYDDERDPRLWEVRFERLDDGPDDVYLIDDETSEVLAL